MVKVVLFDLGNTLYSNKDFDKQYPMRLYEMLAEDKGVSIDEAKGMVKQKGEELKATSDKHLTKVATMAAFGYSRPQVHQAFCKNDPSQYLDKNPPLNDLLSKISSSYKLGIVSNFRGSHTKDILGALGVDPSLFDLIIGEEDVKEIKPDPEGFLNSLEYFSVDPSDAVYVADSIIKDLIPAKSVGLKTILVSNEGEESEYADAVIEDILQIEEGLKKL